MTLKAEGTSTATEIGLGEVGQTGVLVRLRSCRPLAGAGFRRDA